MVLIYDFGLFIYYIGIRIASLFNSKAKKWIVGRKNLFNDLEQTLGKNDKLIWIHSSSLGEFEQGRPLIEKLRNKYPGYKILLSFFSPSGYEVRKNYVHTDHVCYLPLDSRRHARKFLDIVHPTVALFIKYEFWYHYLHELNTRNIPVYLVSANFRENQVFFKWYGSWYRKMLFSYKNIFLQNQSSEMLLKSIGVEQIRITGDTRFDRVSFIASQTRDIPLASAFSNDHFVLVAGSTWDKDEELLANYLHEDGEGMKMLIAPHEISADHLARVKNLFNGQAVMFSTATEQTAREARVMIIDNIGLLSALYRFGRIAYIGGGFGKGIHNILEAATYGIPVMFGPNYHKFHEATRLVSLQGAFPVEDLYDFSLTLNRLRSDTGFLSVSGEVAGKFVNDNLGATDAVLSVISKHLSPR